MRRTRTRSRRSRANSIFTNCALTDDGDIWWEGMTDEPPGAPDRLARQRLDARVRDARGAPQRALHRPRRAGPGDRPRVGGPGRRADRRDPVRRAPLDGRAAGARGVRLGARRVPRRDDELGEDGRRRRHRRRTALRPVRDAALLRLQHGRLLRPLAQDRPHRRARKLPKIFYVNWFRKDDDGRFLWPGFGENSRVLAWVFARCAGHGAAEETPIGLIPPVGPDGIDTRGVDVSDRGDGRAAPRRRRRVARRAAADPRALRAVRPAAARADRAARGARGSASPDGYSWPWASAAAAGGRDSSASEVIVRAPRAASSSTSVASSSERA